MNNQTPSSSNKRTPQTPSSSNQHGKTKVFILSPDILKKLGFASKIPNFATAKSVANVSNSNTTGSLKEDTNKNDEENTKNRVVTNVNKDIQIKNVNDTEKSDQKNIPNQKEQDEQQEENSSIVSEIPNLPTTKSIATVSISQPNVSLKKDHFNEEENFKNIIDTNSRNKNYKVNKTKIANATKKYDRTDPPKEKEDKLNTVSKIPNLPTAKSVENVSYSPNITLKTGNMKKEQQIGINLNKEDSTITEIINTSEAKVYCNKDPPQKHEEKLSIITSIPNLPSVKSVENVPDCPPTITLNTDDIKENVKSKVVTNLNKEDNVTEINISETKMCSNKDPLLKQNEEESKNSILNRILNLPTVKSVENVSDCTPNTAFKTGNIKKKQHVKNKVVTNLNKEDNNVTEINISETKMCSNKEPPLKQKEEESKDSILTRILNLPTVKSPNTTFKTGHIKEKQYVKNEVVTNLKKVDDKVTEIITENETNKNKDKNLPLKQKDEEEKLSTVPRIPNLNTTQSVEEKDCFTLNSDNMKEEQHAKNKTDTNLSNEDDKVAEIKNTSKIKICSNKDRLLKQKEKEEKLSITTRIQNLPPVISVENVSDSTRTISLNTDNIKEVQDVKKIIVTNSNKEDNKVTEMCNKEPPLKQKLEEEKLSIITRISNVSTANSVEIANTDNIQEEQDVKNKIVTKSTEEDTKVTEIKNISETKICSNKEPPLKQKLKEDKKSIITKIPNSQSNVSVEIDNMNENVKNKILTNLNEKNTEVSEIQNTFETKKCNLKEPSKLEEKEENSVKSKLFSMLTAKLENEKLKSTTSNSPETTTDKQIINLKNQLKPKETITKKLLQTKLFQYCIPTEKKTEKHETDLRTNKKSVTNIKLDTKSKATFDHNALQKNVDCNFLAHENDKINTNRTFDDKNIEQSTSLFKNNESSISNDNDHKKIITFVANTDKQTDHKIVESEIEFNKTKNNNEIISNTLLAEKSTPKRTPKGMKRKLPEVSSSEDQKAVTPIRKSDRKRKLSTLHSDYITELKLHDGSSQKVQNKGRKSVDVKVTDICDQNNEENTNDLENITFLNKKRKTNHKVIQEIPVSKNSDKIVENKTVILNQKSVGEICAKSDSETRSISDSHGKHDICKNEKEKEENQNIGRKSSNMLIITNRANKLNAIESPSNTKSKSNSNTELLNVSKSESKCNKNGNNEPPPKKQIIILENILIKSPTKIDTSNLSANQNIINIPKPTISKLSANNSDNKKIVSEKVVLQKGVTINIKTPLKTYSGKRKDQINPKNLKARSLTETVKATVVTTKPETTQNIDEVKGKCEVLSDSSIITHEKTSLGIKEGNNSKNDPISESVKIVENTKPEVLSDTSIITHEKTSLGIKEDNNSKNDPISENVKIVDNTKTKVLSDTSIITNEKTSLGIKEGNNSKNDPISESVKIVENTKTEVLSDTSIITHEKTSLGIKEDNNSKNDPISENVKIVDNTKTEVLSDTSIITHEKTSLGIKEDNNSKNDPISESVKIVENTKTEINSPQIISLSETNKAKDEKLDAVILTETSNSIITKESSNDQNTKEVNKETEEPPISITETPVKTAFAESYQLKSIRKPENIRFVNAEIVISDNIKHEILGTLGTTTPSRPKRIQTKTTKNSNLSSFNIETKIEKNVKQEIITPTRTLSLKTDQTINELPTASENKTRTTTTIQNRRRQARKNEFEPEIVQSPIVNTEIESNHSADNIKSEPETTTPNRRRGRKPASAKVVPDEESLPKRGKKRKIEDIADQTPKKWEKDVTCGVCNEEVDRLSWNSHSLKHNFLCWKVGETPLDLNDRKLVEYILHKSLKQHKMKHFTCPHCADKKKSVLGFLAHTDMCQLTDEERLSLMVACSVCSKKVLPQSMKSHMKIHEDKSSIREESIILQASTENLNSSRTKRKAATKAANLIQEVASQENVASNSHKEITTGKKYYKKASDPGSVFITFGVIKKFKTDFNSVSKKCRFKNCTFECQDFEEMKKHLNTCPFVNSDDYICRFCLHVESDENVIKKHVKDKHVDVDQEEYKDDGSGNESYDDEDDDDEFNENELVSDEENRVVRRQTKNSLEFKPVYKAAFLAQDRRVSDPISSYLPAIKWTYEFRQKNYSEYVFDHIKCLSSSWTLISSSEHEKYMPRFKKSMSVKTYSIAHKIPNLQKREHEWKEYNLYETTVEDDTTVIYSGGPIWALAWVPTPLNSICDQYLAVSLQKDFEATYPLSESSSGQEIIQFWNFGALQSKKKVSVPPPTLEFSIAHNHGMIWCMEWCPSGFYDTGDPDNENEFKKLGLLALACSDGSVPIYAIGIPHKKENIKDNIFQVKPVYKLILQDSKDNLLGQWQYQATKISWSKNSGHNVIAGGFSNGMVCLWDLENPSPLLKSEVDGIIVLKPFLSFQAHFSVVSALILYPLVDKGRRWLLSGSWDRNFKYWDLNNISAPISSFGKRGFITDGVWLPHWLCSFLCFDDIFNFGHNVTTVQNPRDFGFKQCSALASNSVVMSLSGNDWASAIAQGSLAGELSTTFPRTMLLSYDVDKHLKCKRMLLSYNDIIDKTKDISQRKDIMKSEKKPEKIFNDRDDKLFSQYLANSGSKESYVEEPTTYEEARKKYGILFCDLKLDQFSTLPVESLEMVRQSNRLHEVPTELYPVTSLNKTVWNPNKQAYLYVACGYQNGFVRLRCVRFMNTNRMNSFL